MNKVTLGVFLRPQTPELKEYFLEFKSLATNLGFNVLLEISSAEMIEESGIHLDDVCSKSDILISIGGDGTLISTARISYDYQKPILGINMGNLGFLTDLQKEDVASFLPNLKSQNYNIANHMILESYINNKRFYSLNDVVITRYEKSMLTLKAYIDNKYFNSYYGDGLIVSTPTGSTAYNISAGGAVVYPFSENLLLTPICAHSLTQRPLILPSEFNISIKTQATCHIIFDGQETSILNPDDTLSIKALKKGVKLIHNKEWDYFKILKEKFHWGDYE